MELSAALFLFFVVAVVTIGTVDGKRKKRRRPLLPFRDVKIQACIEEQQEKMEGSGIIALGSSLYVVLDNYARAIVNVDRDLNDCTGSPEGSLMNLPGDKLPEEDGYEAITLLRGGGPDKQDLFVLVEEIVETEKGSGERATKEADNKLKAKGFYAKVSMFDSTLSTQLMGRQTLSFEFDTDNKGVEVCNLSVCGTLFVCLCSLSPNISFSRIRAKGSATVVTTDGTIFLLTLCEGNECRGGKVGHASGNGWILVYYLNEGGTNWIYNDRIKLPADADFRDYSGMDVRKSGVGKRVWSQRTNDDNIYDIVVISQEDSALWLGQIDAKAVSKKPSGWDWKAVSTTAVFQIGEKGDEMERGLKKKESVEVTTYCNLEGGEIA